MNSLAPYDRQVSEVIRDWELEELVERAKAADFKPRRRERSWRREPRGEGELTQPLRGG